MKTTTTSTGLIAGTRLCAMAIMSTICMTGTCITRTVTMWMSM